MAEFGIDGFTEAVVIVTDPVPHLDTWLDEGGWELRHTGASDPAQLDAWGCGADSGHEWLLGHPDCAGGQVRLVRLDRPAGAAQRPRIRADDQCWDTGGIFDLNVRVPAVQPVAAALRARGWHGASLPSQWDFGVLTVREWLVKGPDNLRLAVIERVAPPLQGFGHMKKMSQVFNSSQIVRDLDAARAFYCGVLGFVSAYRYATPALPAGPNVFGLPASLAQRVGLEIDIVHPQGQMEGSIELVALGGAGGIDMAADARPPHPGLAVLRLPVRNMDAFEAHLAAQGMTPEFAPRTVMLAPLGRVRMLGLRAPEGAWLEFYEPI